MLLCWCCCCYCWCWNPTQIALLRKRNFKSGDHVDYYDEKVQRVLDKGVLLNPSLCCLHYFNHIIKYTRSLSGQGGRRRRRRWQCHSHPTSCNEHNSSASCSVITLPGHHLVMTSESISSEWSLLICFLIGDTKPRPFAAFRLCYRIYSKAFTRTVYY